MSLSPAIIAHPSSTPRSEEPRARLFAGELHYVGKETDRKWEEGNDLSVVEFKTTGKLGTGKLGTDG